MATKNNPGKFDCYAKAEPDEPMFVLLARDPAAPLLVRLWADMHPLLKETSQEQIGEAIHCAAMMEYWRKQNRPAPPRPEAQEPFAKG